MNTATEGEAPAQLILGHTGARSSMGSGVALEAAVQIDPGLLRPLDPEGGRAAMTVGDVEGSHALLLLRSRVSRHDRAV